MSGRFISGPEMLTMPMPSSTQSSSDSGGSGGSLKSPAEVTVRRMAACASGVMSQGWQ